MYSTAAGLLVTPDVLGLYDRFTLSFEKEYQDVGTLMLNTFKQYAEEVRNGVSRRGASLQDV
jgi:3-methyl-2-oxobutanoate hydroxymethyltransferase